MCKAERQKEGRDGLRVGWKVSWFTGQWGTARRTSFSSVPADTERITPEVRPQVRVYLGGPLPCLPRCSPLCGSTRRDLVPCRPSLQSRALPYQSFGSTRASSVVSFALCPPQCAHVADSEAPPQAEARGFPPTERSSRNCTRAYALAGSGRVGLCRFRKGNATSHSRRFRFILATTALAARASREGRFADRQLPRQAAQERRAGWRCSCAARAAVEGVRAVESGWSHGRRRAGACCQEAVFTQARRRWYRERDRCRSRRSEASQVGQPTSLGGDERARCRRTTTRTWLRMRLHAQVHSRRGSHSVVIRAKGSCRQGATETATVSRLLAKVRDTASQRYSPACQAGSRLR
jgi:hypothetical protein